MQFDFDISDRLRQQIEFIVEIDGLKQVFRRSFITDGSRRENDAEHSWHLAVMAMLLAEYAPGPEIDLLRVLRMVLIHDVVELVTGDTFVYDAESRARVAVEEALAAEKVFGMLPEPEGSNLRVLWQEFEARETPEARYARALDRLQPILLNYCSEGKTWREHGIRADAVRELNIPVLEAGAPELARFLEGLLDQAVERGCLDP
jgi:putative hydrolases of HD superfamily